MARGYINSDFDNKIIDVVYEIILRYFQNNVSYHLGVIDLFNKEWYYDKVGRVIWNYVHDYSDEGNDVEIRIGLSKNYNGYFIFSDVNGGKTIEVKSRANSLGSIVDEITTDIMNIEDTLIKGIEQGTLI
jgi:hypothetical protein